MSELKESFVKLYQNCFYFAEKNRNHIYQCEIFIFYTSFILVEQNKNKPAFSVCV